MVEAALKVLVVDDDPTTLLVTRARLQAAGFQVQTRAEALGTSAQIAAWQPDLILLDVNMPGLSGPALAELVRARGTRHPSIVFHSGEDGGRLAELTAGHGALGYIVKSADGEAFLAAFRELAERHLAERPDHRAG